MLFGLARKVAKGPGIWHPQSTLKSSRPPRPAPAATREPQAQIRPSKSQGRPTLCEPSTGAVPRNARTTTPLTMALGPGTRHSAAKNKTCAVARGHMAARALRTSPRPRISAHDSHDSRVNPPAAHHYPKRTLKYPSQVTL